MSRAGAANLSSTYLRLKPDSSIEKLTAGNRFWERLAAGELGEFRNEYLIAMHAFENDWSLWEMHPNGEEVVCLVSGSISFVLDEEPRRRAVTMDRNGAFVVVPRGVWHTAKVIVPSQVLFITAGEGTMHRPV